MSSQPQIFSPLTQKEKIASDNISLELIEFLGKINLRLKENDSQARDAVEKYLTYSLPKSAGEVTGNNETRVLWLGPNEYLLLSEDEKKDNVINGLREILSDLFCAITDVSDYYLTMRLSGPKSIEVLTKACPLNFDQYLTKGNSCAQSYISAVYQQQSSQMKKQCRLRHHCLCRLKTILLLEVYLDHYSACNYLLCHP